MTNINQIAWLKILFFILIITVSIILIFSAAITEAQFLPFPYFIQPPAMMGYSPFPMINCRLMYPFCTPTFAPAPFLPPPLHALPSPALRRGATTTTLLLGAPTGLIPPSVLLLSLLFSPPTTTTVPTATASLPQSISNNPTASPTLTLNRLTTTVATPALPGLSSLFLPLLI